MRTAITARDEGVRVEEHAALGRSRWPWLWLAASVGAGVRLVQFLGDHSLGLDESALARNVADRSWRELLFAPLDYDQVAPAAYLAVEKLALSLLGPSEVALRAPALLAGLASIPLFVLVARRLLRPWSVVAATLVFGVGWAFVVYSASLKQYAFDVFAALLLVEGALRLDERRFDLRGCLAMAVAGSAVMLLSFPAVPLAACLGLVLAVRWWRLHDEERRPWLGFVALGASWSVAAAAQTLLSRITVSNATRAYMKDFWQDGFVPWDSGLGENLLWPVTAFESVVDLMLLPAPEGAWWERPLLWLVLGMAAVGSGALLRRAALRQEVHTAAFLLTPLVVALLLASAALLPLRGRSGLYAGAFLLLLGFFGAERLAGRAGVAVLALLCVMPFALDPPPWRGQPMSQVLDEVIERRQPGDRIYAYYGAGQAMAWYAPQKGLDAWVQGACHRGDVRRALREIDALRGETLWLVVTHARPPFQDVEPLLAYLRTIGVETDAVPDPYGNVDAGAAFAHRFDLRDDRRLLLADAESFDDVGEFEGDPAELCTGPAAKF